MTLVIRKDINQLVSWSDTASGQSGLDGVLEVIAKQLQSEDESGGLVIGDLIIHLLRRAGESVLPVLPQLLEAMVRRMRTAKTATFLQVRLHLSALRCLTLTFSASHDLQSLIVPFAFLIHNQRDTVLDLLEGQAVDGTPALEVFTRTWCENAETFQGFWPPRVSTLALCACFASARPSLQGIIVKGDIIVKPETKNGESFLPVLPSPWRSCCIALCWVARWGSSDHDAFADEVKYALKAVCRIEARR